MSVTASYNRKRKNKKQAPILCFIVSLSLFNCFPEATDKPSAPPYMQKNNKKCTVRYSRTVLLFQPVVLSFYYIDSPA